MTNDNLPSVYSEKDVAKARTKGQLIGWVQGAAVGVIGMILLNLVGWIPTVLIMGAGGFVVYKLSGSSKDR